MATKRKAFTPSAPGSDDPQPEKPTIVKPVVYPDPPKSYASKPDSLKAVLRLALIVRDGLNGDHPVARTKIDELLAEFDPPAAQTDD